VQTQVAELNQKVGGTFGGVIYSPSSASEATTSFTVTTADRRVKLSCKFNVSARKFVSDATHAGAIIAIGDGRHRDFNFQVNPENGDVWVTSEQTIYRDPTEIATMLLKEVFGRP